MKIKDTEIEIVKGQTDGLDIVAALDDEHALRRDCAQALSSAKDMNTASVALNLSWRNEGNAAIDVGAASKIMAQEVLKFARFDERGRTVKKIVFCLSQEEAFEIFNTTMRGYIDHIQDDLGSGPYVTVDIIIELAQGIILIERSNPPYGWALPGGFVDQGESLEEAVVREAKEETHMDLVDLRQFHTYSKPDRDPRFHTVSTVFIAKGKGTPQSGDDAKGLKVVRYEDLLKGDYAFDHKGVIQDYLCRNEK